MRRGPIDGGACDTAWAQWAVGRIREAHTGAETPLVEFSLPARLGVQIVFKDESAHPSGSLKHRLAASLTMFGVCNGDIGPGSTLVDASSGSTAISEAFFARVLGLRFVAVVPEGTSPSKIALIEEMGGSVEFSDSPQGASALAEEMGTSPNHVFLDQFGNASLKTDWRYHNVASALFTQLQEESRPEPDWVVVGAGTGGTSSTLARHIRFTGVRTKVAIADPEGSAYYPCWRQQDPASVGRPSRIEGIGRPTVEPSFIPQLIDDVVPVPDAWSVAAMRALDARGVPAGPSTGANLAACLHIAASMHATGHPGTIASIINDSADRYRDTYFDDAWLASQDIHLDNRVEQLLAFLEGSGPLPRIA